MLSKRYQFQVFKKRLVLFLITTTIFIVGFVLNIDMNRPLYNVNLNEVPVWQNDQFWGSDGFLTFMNVISNIFNPLICAGYIILFFLISYRKLQILVFLIWFIFLSWILSVLKMIFHQARPYWIQQSGIQMLEWTCYTQYGMPSGHSMMAIILMQFIVRFFAKINKCVSKCIILFYILIIILQVCVMFSRVILGMHSLNQVLLGCLLGCFSFIPYYLFIQRFILTWIISIFQSPKSIFTMIILICISICALATEILIAILLPYYNTNYIDVINTISGCNGYQVYKSFQYKCLEDSALIMAAVGILAAFNYMKNPSHLSCQLMYSKCSLKFLGRFVITIVIPGIIVAIFLNPLWQRIPVGVTGMAFIIWACQVVGFFFGTFALICLVPMVNKKCGFQLYRIPQNYQQYRKYQSTQFKAEDGFRLSNILVKKIRQTELTQTDKSIQVRLQVNQSIKPI